MKRNFFSTSNILAVVIGLAVQSCEPVFIPDPIDPRLPKYTQSGNNVAGALVNDTVWNSNVHFGFLSSSHEPFLQYFTNQDSLAIIFSGQRRDEEYPTYISFGLSGTGITSLARLATLNGKKFQLGSDGNVATINTSGGCTVPGTGQIYFRSVRFFQENSYVILSGTFGFDGVDPICGNQRVTYGRFDFRIIRLEVY